MVAVALRRETDSPPSPCMYQAVLDSCCVNISGLGETGVSLCVSCGHKTCYIDQFVLKPTHLPASISLVLGLKVCTLLPG